MVNYVPSDTERREIFCILQEPQARLAKMDDEIERMQAALEEMKRQRDGLSQYIDHYRALTSPIRRLPKEILLEIFVHCLPKEHNAYMSSHEAPLLLGRICSSWRSISLSAPRLWTTIYVPVPRTDMYPWQVIAKAEYIVALKRMVRLRTVALQEWFIRSGSLPVDISFIQWPKAEPANIALIDTAQPIVDVILSVAQRWRNVTVTAPSDDTMASFIAHPPHNLPFLESFDLTFADIRRWPEPVLRITPSEYNIYRAPSLRKLSLQKFGGNPLQLPVTWENLTDLSLNYPPVFSRDLTLHQAVDLLSRCRHLIRCTLAMGKPGEVPPVQLSSFALPYLECFTVHEKAYAASVFSCLELPALRQVTYYTHVALHPSRRSSLLTLLGNSNGSIHELTINPHQLMKEDLMKCLYLIPHATILTFDNRASNFRNEGNVFSPTILHKDLLYSFLPSATRGRPLCPNLQALHVNCHLDMSDEDLLEFILEKQKGVSSNVLPLNRLHIDFRRPQRIDIESDLKMVKGFDLQLRYAARSMKTLFSPSEVVDDRDMGFWLGTHSSLRD